MWLRPNLLHRLGSHHYFLYLRTNFQLQIMAFGLLEATRDGTPMCCVNVTESYVLES